MHSGASAIPHTQQHTLEGQAHASMMTNCFCFVLLLPSTPAFISSQFLLYYEAAAPAPYRTINLYQISGHRCTPHLRNTHRTPTDHRCSPSDAGQHVSHRCRVCRSYADNIYFLTVNMHISETSGFPAEIRDRSSIFGAFRAEIHISSVHRHLAMNPRSTQP